MRKEENGDGNDDFDWAQRFGWQQWRINFGLEAGFRTETPFRWDIHGILCPSSASPVVWRPTTTQCPCRSASRATATAIGRLPLETQGPLRSTHNHHNRKVSEIRKEKHLSDTWEYTLDPIPFPPPQKKTGAIADLNKKDLTSLAESHNHSF